MHLSESLSLSFNLSDTLSPSHKYPTHTESESLPPILTNLSRTDSSSQTDRQRGQRPPPPVGQKPARNARTNQLLVRGANELNATPPPTLVKPKKTPPPQMKSDGQSEQSNHGSTPVNSNNNGLPNSPKAALMPPPTDPLFYEWMEMYEKLHRLNRILETKASI